LEVYVKVEKDMLSLRSNMKGAIGKMEHLESKPIPKAKRGNQTPQIWKVAMDIN
jgi:hypothetical protein